MKVVPRPYSESTSILPPKQSLRMFLEMGSPRPVPSPGGLVVKSSSKMRGRCSGAIPPASSLTLISTPSGPGPAEIRTSPAALAGVPISIDGVGEQVRYDLAQPRRITEELRCARVHGNLVGCTRTGAAGAPGAGRSR